MRKGMLVVIAAACAIIGYTFADTKEKDAGLEQQISQLSAKLDSVLTMQDKLDTILANQDKIMQMLRVIRAR
jgi:Tfp pilus assembly protein PilN